MIITKTPFRISFCGGGSDMEDFYKEHGGCVLSTTINRYVYLIVHPYFEKGHTVLKYSENERVDDLDLREAPGGLDGGDIVRAEPQRADPSLCLLL